MKKSIVLIACMSTAIVYGAENNKSLACLVNGTVFLVTKDDMYSHHTSVDVMVVGRNEQQRLKRPSLNDCMDVGRIYHSPDKRVYVLSKDSDSSSDDDTYKSFQICDTGLWKDAIKKELECDVFAIIEPRLIYTYSEEGEGVTSYTLRTLEYFPQKVHPTKQTLYICGNYSGQHAIDEASKDLEMCYNKALHEGLTILKGKEEKNIALASLGTAVGFPRDKAVPITFKAIIDFIKSNAEYIFVQLFVKKRSEFALYKKLIDEYSSQQQ